ncbi:MAG: hypothetical protein AAF754_07555 [Pseudomonadota bacterium]
MSSSTKQFVTRRRVFYVPGYDPFHPRRYRELHRCEGAKQAAISNYSMDLRRKTDHGCFGWHVTSKIDEQVCDTDFDVLVWSDIVRSSMDGPILRTYGQLVRTAWIYTATGAIFRLMKLRKGPVIAALYPVFLLVLQGLAALLLAWGIYQLVTWGFGFVRADSVAGLPILHKFAGAGAGLAAAIRLMRWFKSVDNRLFAHYLMHDYAYSASKFGAYTEDLETRIAEFRSEIRAALCAPCQEVLIVGHSSGAHLAVSVLADLIRAGEVPANGPALSFLSLGQVVPMVSFLPKADRLRADLRFLSERDEITWVDVTAPGDGCSFALCDPVAVSGVATQASRGPLMFSAAFTQSLRPETWAKLKRRYFRLHFQYLCAFDQPKDYDYFQITGGPITLAERYAERKSSKSCIMRPVNKYTSVAA